MKILLTGATGLIGSRFEELAHETQEIIPLSSFQGIDITDKNSIEQFLEDKEFDVAVHLAAKTDVDGCELDKEEDLRLLGTSEDNVMGIDLSSVESKSFQYKKTAIAINTIGTKNLYEVVKARGKKFVYVSSDFVFSGNEEFNTEQTNPSPVNWYGMSKYLGEKIVDHEKDLVIRLSFPYGFMSPVKKDFVWKLHDLLQANDEVSLVSDQMITPTFIDDIVNGIQFLLDKEASGLFHLTGSSAHTPMQIGQKIKDAFAFSTAINPMSLATLYEGKAPRPFQSRMKNVRLVNLGFVPKTFDEGLSLIQY
ncbi:MAG: SDR family oxidoreductase [Candidatus Levybacteria bacterium]|nr:SDR family oxidoreductase [Candidatus Levybacteria bacterium]